MKKLTLLLKRFPWGILLFSILFALSGLLFIIKPDSFQYLKLVIGIITSVFAVFYTVGNVLASEDRGFKFWSGMILGVTALICGIFFAISKEASNSFLFAFFGYFFIIDGSFKLQTSYLSKRYHSWLWWVMLVLSMLSIIGGVILDLFRPQFVSGSLSLKAMVLIVGFVLFVEGVSNFLSIFFSYKIKKESKATLINELENEGKIVSIVSSSTVPSIDNTPLTVDVSIPESEEVEIKED